MRTVPQSDPPRPRAASNKSCGVCAKTSRATTVIIGTIMIPKTQAVINGERVN